MKSDVNGPTVAYYNSSHSAATVHDFVHKQPKWKAGLPPGGTCIPSEAVTKLRHPFGYIRYSLEVSK